MNYFASKLFTPQMLRHIEVSVLFTKKLDECFTGEVGVDDYNVLGAPREFTILVKKGMDEEEILKTLSHELVHVRQYARQELNEECTRWRGRRINSDEVDYYDLPWEKEAFTIGDQLYEEYINESR